LRLPGLVRKLLAPQSQQPFSALVRLPYDFENIFYNLFEGGMVCRHVLDAGLKQEKLRVMQSFTDKLTPFRCPSGCYICCSDIILMSYVEYRLILDYLKDNWSKHDILETFKKRVGNLSFNNSPLCPFVNHDSHPGHCLIYPARPLVCRAYGTAVHPCVYVDLGKYPPCNEKIYHQAHFDLMHNGKDLIGIKIDNKRVILLASFEMWAVLDTVEPEARKKVFSTYICCKRFSFSAVISDQNERLIIYENGRITRPGWFNFA